MIIDFFKSVLLGIVEGITEWLPISSTGHMILVNEFTNTTEGFLTTDVYLYVIQLGAILAIATLYFKKLNPFSPKKTPEEKRDTWQMWFKVLVACIPTAVIGFLLNDFMENFENSRIKTFIIGTALIIYGIAFIFIERKNKTAAISDMNQLTYKTAILIGLFQSLSIIPGTSRSGSTILGAMLLGCSRGIAAEFSFFLAIPVMFGVSLLKLLPVLIVNFLKILPLSDADFLNLIQILVPNFLTSPSDYLIAPAEWGMLIVGMIVAYIVSIFLVKFLVNYVRNHDFKVFGYYRIILGVIVILYFGIKMML